jgi:hypothetical protein
MKRRWKRYEEEIMKKKLRRDMEERGINRRERCEEERYRREM